MVVDLSSIFSSRVNSIAVPDIFSLTFSTYFFSTRPNDEAAVAYLRTKPIPIQQKHALSHIKPYHNEILCIIALIKDHVMIRENLLHSSHFVFDVLGYVDEKKEIPGKKTT